ncbi:MAG TPA: serine hydrolase [Saprospiraceae bacterium]|nr:serine hydrolase [Saprospiraceae bacterium]
MDWRIYIFIISLISNGCLHLYNVHNPLEDIMASEIPAIKSVADSLNQYELQIIFTPLFEKDGQWKPGKRHTFRLDTTHYFYPASTVKMPVAFLALQKLKELREKGYPLTRDTPIFFGEGRAPMTSMDSDTCSSSGLPTIASMIEQIFTVSDNISYVRLYEFLGQEYINNELRKKGIFTNSRIITRVGVTGFSTEENRYVNPFYFGSKDSPLYQEELRYSHFQIPEVERLSLTFKGKGYLDQDGNLQDGAFDMSEKNFINLPDLERSLMVALFPEWYDESSRYTIDEDDDQFLQSTLVKLPKDFPCYSDTARYYDGYVKFFMYGDTKLPIPQNITIKNKVGFAYGTLTDCSYIEDRQRNIRFFLTATILVNRNGIFNDGVYEYKELGLPFMAALGREVYRYMVNNYGD